MRTRICVVFVSAVLLASSLFAVDDPPAAPPATTVSDQLVVTATLVPERPEQLPVAVEIVERAEIERRDSGDALDLLRTIPGLTPVQAGSPGKQASLFTRGAGSAQTVVVWNGIELNDPAFAGYDWSQLATDGVERIEVVRGPYSAIWGSGAMGGVVQLVTARGAQSPTSLRLEGGSHSSGRASGAFGTELGALELDLAGHLRTGEGELDNDGFEGAELDLRLGTALGDSARLGLIVRALDSEIGLPFDFFGTPAAERRQSFESLLAALPLGFARGQWSLDGTLSTVDSTLELSDPNDPFAAGTTEATRDAVRLVVRRDFDAGGWLATGGELEREQASTASAFGPGLDDERADSTALFAQAGLSRGRVGVELGARRDDHDAFGGATSFRGGLVVRAGDRWLLRASGGESFRAPSLGDLYFPGFSNPGLEPERGRSFELGAEATAGRLRLGVAVYENEFRELIQFDFLTFAPENIGRARARGVESWAHARFGAVDLRAGASWLDSEDLDSGEPLPRRPERSAHLVASGRTGEVGLDGSLLVVGPRADVGGVRLGGHTVVDLGLRWLGRERFEPYLRVENALDRDYEETVGFPAPGRTFTVGVALRAVR